MTEIRKKAPARKPRAGKAARSAATFDLLTALEWIRPAQKLDGTAPYETHCVIAGGYVTAFNGVLAAGHKIELDLTATPRTDRFIAALAKAGTGLSITYDDALMVASDRLRVTVPTLVAGEVVPPLPDSLGQDYCPVTDDLLTAIATVATVAKEGANTVLQASIRLGDGTATATDRAILLQYWHGLLLPTLIIPKISATVICKQEGLTHVAWSDRTMTFWFGDIWYRAQLYDAGEWPSAERLEGLFENGDESFVALPDGFGEAVEAVAPHSDNATVCLYANAADTPTARALFGSDTGPAQSLIVKPDQIALILPHTGDGVIWFYNRKIHFRGGMVRGVLAHMADWINTRSTDIVVRPGVLAHTED